MRGSSECEPLRVAFFECKRSLVRDQLYVHMIGNPNFIFACTVHVFFYSWTIEFDSEAEKDTSILNFVQKPHHSVCTACDFVFMTN
jgi:hypothetical protein